MWGQTVEMNSPEYNLSGAGQIAVGAWRENDPMAYWVRANCAVQPILTKGPNPGKWTRGFNQDAIVSVADPAASKAFGER